MIDRIDTHAKALHVRRALLWLLIALPFVLAWTIGIIVRVLAIIIAASAEGYARGRG